MHLCCSDDIIVVKQKNPLYSLCINQIRFKCEGGGGGFSPHTPPPRSAPAWVQLEVGINVH